MHLRVTRRTLLAAAALAPLVPAATATVPPSADEAATKALADLEHKSGGRLGAYILNTADGRGIGHRAGERFAMCSTFKLPLAGAVLHMADRGKLKLDTVVPYTKADLAGMGHAPVTEVNLAKGGMTIGALAEAAQIQSDNLAANLLLKHIGGPAVLTKFFRELGDTVTRLDRYEPEMNHVVPGDDRDTTTPAAKAAAMEKLLTTDLLKHASRKKLIGWMIDTKTGLKRVRAGLPPDWRVGDKTGTGYDDICGKVNDVVIAWPPGEPPLIITAYFNTLKPVPTVTDEHQAVVAEVGRIAANWINR